MTGPFGLPWLTFAALTVIAGSTILAIIWSARSSDRDDSGTGGTR